MLDRLLLLKDWLIVISLKRLVIKHVIIYRHHYHFIMMRTVICFPSHYLTHVFDHVCIFVSVVCMSVCVVYARVGVYVCVCVCRVLVFYMRVKLYDPALVYYKMYMLMYINVCMLDLHLDLKDYCCIWSVLPEHVLAYRLMKMSISIISLIPELCSLMYHISFIVLFLAQRPA